VSGVHFTDGFDRPDTIAFGLDAPRLVTVVIAALSAYAVMQAPLPLPLRVLAALLLVSTGALLGWARHAGRPLLTWTWLALRFAVSPRSGGGMVAAPRIERDAIAHQPEVAPAVVPVAEAPPPAPGPELPPWARWLEVEDDVPTSTPATAVPTPMPPLPADTVETPRAAPLVVVMDGQAAGEGGSAGHDDAPEDNAPPR